MACDPILTEARIEKTNAAGLWPNRLITDYLDEAVAAGPERAAIVAWDSAAGRLYRLGWGELARIVERMALGLNALGVKRGDVVSLQLPNCWQFTALYLACSRIGAVTNPLMPIFRERELAFMLGLAESKVVVIPRAFRRMDYPAMLRSLRPRLPALERVLVIGGDGEESFEAALTERAWEEERDAHAVFAANRPSPNDVTQLLYTSGTTGEPKGVMHTYNTLMATISVYAERLRLGADDVVFMASPLAHQLGFTHGMMMPVVLGATAVLQDAWEPERAARLIAEEGCTFTMASTPFLADLTDVVEEKGIDLPHFRTFVAAGATIPRALALRASRVLDARVIAVFGTSENGAVTMTRPDDEPEKAFSTDGVALRGWQVRVVDGLRRPLPPGQEGALEVCGMANFVGYLRRPELYRMDEDGWFDTGDLARMDADGYIRITGRSKDIIIRGGENVPVAEVEELLYQHPAVREVAVVAMPDARLGERACAFVTLRPGAALGFAEMIAYLEGKRMARQYFPERLEILETMPHTPSGKIQKFRLREIAAGLAAAAGAARGARKEGP